MKKNLFLIALIPILLFTSCENENVIDEKKGIIGTWYIYYISSETDIKYLASYIFEKSGKGKATIFNLPFVDFTYTVKDSKLLITPSGEDILTVIGTTLGDYVPDESIVEIDIVSLTKSKLVLRAYDEEQIILYSTEEAAKANPNIV